MAFELFNDLLESRLIRSKSSLSKYDARDIADLTFLYFIAMEILAQEFSTAGFASKYARKTITYNNFDRLITSSTDLYVLLHVLMGKNNDDARQKLKNTAANDIFFQGLVLPLPQLKKYFTDIQKNKRDTSFSRRLLYTLQNRLRISNSNYRSMRILASDWREQTEERKRLTMTRLLMAFRKLGMMSELLPVLDGLAKRNKYEIKNANNPEEKAPKNDGNLWKTLAIGALGAAGGAYAGYKLVRDPNIRKHRTWSTT